MWKCPECEFENDDDVLECICGTSKITETENNSSDEYEEDEFDEISGNGTNVENEVPKIPNAPPEIMVPPTPPKSNKAPAIIIGCVAFVAVIACIILIINITSHKENEEIYYNESTEDVITTDVDESTVGNTDSATYFVNTFDDSGIFVRTGPGKEYPDILYIAKGDTSVRLLYLGYSEYGSDGFTWYQVQIPNGDVGYVREDVVRVD